jgi:taurine dioxygenase
MTTTAAADELQIERMGGYVGAYVSGVDLRQPQDPSTVAAVKRALAEYGVIFLRDQELTSADYVRFAEQFGPIEVSRMTPTVADNPNVAELRREAHQTGNLGGSWHTDQAYRSDPITVTMLLARELPPYGGDTLYINMAAVFESLSPGLQETLSGLSGVNSQEYYMTQTDITGLNVINLDQPKEEAVHPAVLTHPDTGRRSLFVNPEYTYRFDGWTPEESMPLLTYLFQRALRPEFSCRFHWQLGSLAIWDNRQVWHYASNDYLGHQRVMHRMMVHA